MAQEITSTISWVIDSDEELAVMEITNEQGKAELEFCYDHLCWLLAQTIGVTSKLARVIKQHQLDDKDTVIKVSEFLSHDYSDEELPVQMKTIQTWLESRVGGI